MGIIALITDFGTRDWYAGEMKGAILSVAPHATIVDIAHDLDFGDITGAAFSLLSCYRTFPQGTVFCVVVDPGVGSSRPALAAGCGSYFFIGPDNGVLSWTLEREKTYSLRRIENRALLPKQVSATFHGRDIFAPIAAYLSSVGDIDTVGPTVTECITLPWCEPRLDNGRIIGTIVYIDRFGNAITTITRNAFSLLPSSPTSVSLRGSQFPLCTFYQEAGTGKGLAYFGASGYLEIAVNRGNASVIFGLRTGDAVEAA
ncbi:MAG: SAM-dependent chlorinase/fluorinase [Chitinispirillaceae bacterium]|jgi:S-adenosylmethionine hydrolase